MTRWRPGLFGPRHIRASISERAVRSEQPALVLLHGLGMSSRYLAPTIELLAHHHRVLAPDLPGCGRSRRPDRALNPAELAEIITAWMEALGLDRPTLVGHSVGAQVAVHVAALRPDGLGALVLASPTGDPAATRWRQSVALLTDAPREVPSLVPVAARDYLRAGPLRMWRTLGLALDDDVLALLRRRPLGMRTLVVRGDEDQVVSAEWAAAVATAADAELTTIPQAPHGLPYSTPDALADAVGEFLGR